MLFQENIFHKGAPYRIALSPGNDSHFDDYILLDHVPHYDNFNGPLLFPPLSESSVVSDFCDRI